MSIAHRRFILEQTLLDIDARIAEFDRLTSELRKSISEDDAASISRLDAEIEHVLNEILDHAPVSIEEKRSALVFLLELIAPGESRSSETAKIVDRIVAIGVSSP